MKIADQIIFTKITGADFYNIYKAPGAELRGGGQSYIDFSTATIPVSIWREFFTGVPEARVTHGPRWDFELNSLGLELTQQSRIYQRRAASVCITSQKLQRTSRRGNRVFAWHPEYANFPQPSRPPTSASDSLIAPLIQNLVIYIIRDKDREFWAGWFKRSEPHPHWACDPRLRPMFGSEQGYIDFNDGLEFDETDEFWPFGYVGEPERGQFKPERDRTEDQTTELLFDGDVVSEGERYREVVRRIRSRNTKAAKKLKELYGKCQLTGDKFVFVKLDGKPYLEVHHLIPLGEGGADEPHNVVVVSAHMHRMLHYANVSEIDLSKITDNKLDVEINGEAYTISWHPAHSKLVEEAIEK